MPTLDRQLFFLSLVSLVWLDIYNQSCVHIQVLYFGHISMAKVNRFLQVEYILNDNYSSISKCFEQYTKYVFLSKIKAFQMYVLKNSTYGWIPPETNLNRYIFIELWVCDNTPIYVSFFIFEDMILVFIQDSRFS